MALFKSGNPALSEKIFDKAIGTQHTDVMSVRGTLNKFGILFLLVMATAGLAWKMAASGVNVMPYMIGSAIVGFILALVTIFKPQWAGYTAPLYALAEGFFLGTISSYYNFAFAKLAPNIIMQAVGLTFGVVLAMFALYYFRVIQATERFKSIVITATVGIGIFYLIAIVLRLFGISIPFIHEGSTIGIIFSLVVVGIAALNLILDFDMIEQGAQRGAPKFMEWYGAFGLLVTIVWLYLEILRLLAKLSDRR
ncbi:Bax inhibitor-1/YccA family protein [Paraflavitalea soli]|uniref:Bax inhibitor-1/YccA family protein n=1 Tax=Paraflavitalea soli TaxID=2315862 RepID=A0A3B7MQA2_9BACT|nr:Bax inhibitor-1/YccA family protein [Paraflavitalea soli]AXY76318.1 Bax inhibitor-1/YccA family protein [Paraflavitalea soli]